MSNEAKKELIAAIKVREAIYVISDARTKLTQAALQNGDSKLDEQVITLNRAFNDLYDYLDKNYNWD